LQGRWRLFRHDAGREAGPPAWVYVGLYGLALALGLWSAHRFDAVVLWPANGVLLAAVLQLHRRKAIPVILICVALNIATNIVRGDPMPFLWLNPALNLAQVGIAGLLARRVCGAALDLRRPRRLVAFGLLAVVPAVAVCAATAVTTLATLRDVPPGVLLFTLQRAVSMEALGLLTVTPTLLLLARRHRFRDTAIPERRLELTGLFLLLGAVTALVFFQTRLPLQFLLFPPLLLLLFRGTPTWAAAAVGLVILISGFATLHGYGPVVLARLDGDGHADAIPEVMRRLNVLYAFMLAIVVTALPISTVMCERQRLVQRLEARRATAQAARRRAEAADAAKSRFLALMSHEMRTPLHGVVGYAEVLSRRPGLARDVRAQLDQIQTSGATLLTLVEDVLEVTRNAALPCLDTVDLAVTLEQAAAPCREAADTKGIAIVLRVQPEAKPPVLSDGRQMRQILHRLIGNAVKFSTSGTIEVTASREGPDIVLRVADTGPGIDPGVRDRLFQPFAQGDDSLTRVHAGAGLGLAVASRMARTLGGSIALEQSSAAGSTFVVRLPLPVVEDTDHAAPAVPALEADAVPAAAGRILVVDDHPTNREVARLMLAPLGCEIFEAEDGIEAVQMASATPYDLILMDVRMPRMDGLAATRAIRALPPPHGRTPILAITADAMPEDVGRCLAAGMDGHLAKPITHAALFAAIDKVMTAATDPVEQAAA